MRTTINTGLLLAVWLFMSSIAGKAQHSLINSVDQLNSYADEIQPLLNTIGDKIYFVRGHHKSNFGGRSDAGDAYFSEKTDSGTWTLPIPVSSKINNKYFNGILGIRGEELLLYGVYGSSSVPPGTKGISVVRKQGSNGITGEIKQVPIRYYKDGSELYGYSLSEDGNILLLSMESYKSQGAEDIYVSFWDDQSRYWTEPKNLGPIVNSAFQELSPSLTPDNKTLFFSSNGHGGFGSRDIFFTKRLDDSWTNWSPPQNMGAEVNTEGAEMYFQYYPQHQLAIYTSTLDSDGYGDIKVKDYSTQEMEEKLGEQILISAKTEEDSTSVIEFSAPVPGTILVNVNNTEGAPVTFGIRVEIVSDSLEYSKTMAAIGRSEVPISTPGEYNLTINAEGYLSADTLIQVMDISSPAIMDISLKPIEVGTTIQLDNVLFKRGTTELLSSSFHELDVVVEMMTANPSMEIKLAGHTDNQGNARLNQKLSQERVESVIIYLSERGITKSRLSGKGFGGSRPIASNANEDTRKLNRRVEFTIVHQ